MDRASIGWIRHQLGGKGVSRVDRASLGGYGGGWVDRASVGRVALQDKVAVGWAMHARTIAVLASATCICCWVQGSRVWGLRISV